MCLLQVPRGGTKTGSKRAYQFASPFYTVKGNKRTATNGIAHRTNGTDSSGNGNVFFITTVCVMFVGGWLFADYGMGLDHHNVGQ